MQEHNNKPANRENTGRNEDGTFMLGISGNPSGRPKGTMKDYLRRKFMIMSDEDKEKFLINVSAEMQIKLAEGNPKTETDVTTGGKPFLINEGLANKLGIKIDEIPPSAASNS